VRHLRVLLPAFLIPLALWIVLPLGSSGATSAELQRKIEHKQNVVKKAKGKEQVLTTTIAGYTARINRLQGDITVLQRRQDTIQADLDVKQAQLARIQTELRLQRARLAKLRARLDVSRRILAVRLAEIYKADAPDIVTVILSSKGFAELIERGEFMQRINDQDQRVITSVKADRDRTKRAADRLDRLENRQRKITTAILARRNEVAQVKGRLVSKREGWDSVRGEKADVLASVRETRKEAQDDVKSLQAQQAKIEGVIQDSSSSAPSTGTGQLIWPINGTLTSPFCESRAWESCHPGIDIAAPSGTPIKAADSGHVVIASYTGGYGNYTCIQHTSSMSTCYGHQSSFAVSAGQNVSRGQVIGYVGSTGHSTGPHLHFEVRINGSVTNPMNYL
jgi:peptidoglycan DL-endopeptidase CwlO